MNEVEKQILINQQGIINTINHIMVNTCADNSGDFQRQLIECYEGTRKLLNPKKEQSLAEKTSEELNDEKRGIRT